MHLGENYCHKNISWMKLANIKWAQNYWCCFSFSLGSTWASYKSGHRENENYLNRSNHPNLLLSININLSFWWNPSKHIKEPVQGCSLRLPGKSLHDQLYIPMSGDNSLKTMSKIWIALTLNSMVTNLVHRLQETSEDIEERCQLALKSVATVRQLLKQRNLNLWNIKTHFQSFNQSGVDIS